MYRWERGRDSSYPAAFFLAALKVEPELSG